MTAEEVLAAKRDHWSVENGLHWVLDVQMGEDCRTGDVDHSAENMNAVRHIAFNALRQLAMPRASLALRQWRRACNDDIREQAVALLGITPLSTSESGNIL